jgi:GWxTD domain-containing protein
MTLVSFILFASSNSIAQEADTVSHFQFDVLSFQTRNFSSDSARVDVYVAVPYSWLEFLNATEKYVADYKVSVSLFEKQADSIIRKREQELTVTVPTEEWEKLKELDLTRADASQYSFMVHQGVGYEVRISINDLSTHKELTAKKDFTTLTFPVSSSSVSDILIYKSKIGNRILPHIGRGISGLKTNEAGIFCELYNAPQSTPFWLMQRISSVDDGEEVARTTNILVSSGQKRMPVFLPFIQEDLWTGKYVLEVYMLADGNDTMLSSREALIKRSMAYRTRDIEVTGIKGVPLTGLSLDEAIEQIELIATGGAYDSLASANTKQEKRKAIMDFWEKMNWYRNERTIRPEEVFYQRVQYANEHFRGMPQGWRSDQGKVYIMLGTPTSIDKHSFDARNKPYELWRYYDLNQQYYFSDQFMMGEYRLVSIFPPPGTFLWQRESY